MKIVVADEQEKQAVESLLVEVCERELWASDTAEEFASEAPIEVSESMDSRGSGE